MKKMLVTLLAVVLLSGAVIAVKKRASDVASKQALTSIDAAVIHDFRIAFIMALFDKYDPGGKVGGRMRRKMRKMLKKNPMDPELRALAFLKVKQGEAA